MFKSLLTWILLVVILHPLLGCVSVSHETRGDVEKAREYASLGASYLQYGRVEKALRSLKKALYYDEDLYTANSVIALVYQQLKRNEEAEKYFKRSLKLVSMDSHEYGAINNNYAGFLCSLGRLEEAERHFRRAIDHTLYRTPELALENGGICFFEHGDLVKAEGYLREALKHVDKLPRSLFYLAEISLQKGRYLQARAFIQRHLDVSEPNPKGLLLGVKIEKALDDEASARKYADKLVELFPTSKEVNMLADLK